MSKGVQITIITAVGVCFFIFGYFTADTLKIKTPAPASNEAVVNKTADQSGTFAAGWEAAKKRLVDSGFIPVMPENMEIKNVSGEIKEISGDKITLKIRPLEPLADESLDIRTIIAGTNTKIYRLEQRDMKTYNAETENYNKKMQEYAKNPPAEGTVFPAPPEFFNKKSITLAGLKIGDVINVISETDLKTAKEIKAVEISANQQMNQPPATDAKTASSTK